MRARSHMWALLCFHQKVKVSVNFINVLVNYVAEWLCCCVHISHMGTISSVWTVKAVGCSWGVVLRFIVYVSCSYLGFLCNSFLSCGYSGMLSLIFWCSVLLKAVDFIVIFMWQAYLGFRLFLWKECLFLLFILFVRMLVERSVCDAKYFDLVTKQWQTKPCNICHLDFQLQTVASV